MVKDDSIITPSLTTLENNMIAIPQETPTFTHDCDECKFLGQIHDEILYDLYFCPQGGRPTVIARFGNEGSQYKSGLYGGMHDLVLYEAKKRATARGHL